MLKRLFGIIIAAAVVVWGAGATLTAANAKDGERVALVIGNALYATAPPLPEAADARALADALGNAGWTIEAGGAALNLSRTQFLEKLTEFGARARDADQTLLYFAGYAVSIDGADYLAPVDARATTVAELKAQSVSLDALLPVIKPAFGRLIVVLDTRSRRPFAALDTKGLERIAHQNGIDIVYAAQPGSAADGEVRLLGPQIAKALAAEPDLDAALRRAREATIAATHGRQHPLIDVGDAKPHSARKSSASRPRALAKGMAAPAEAPPPAPPEPSPSAAPPSPPAASAPAVEAAPGGQAAPVPQIADTPAAAPSAYSTVPVFYATDREVAKNGSAVKGFTSSRGTGVTYGTCLVTLPKDHRIGEIESASLLHFEFAEDPARHVILQQTDSLPAAEFFAKLSEKVASQPGRSAFIFIHGYNVSFADAARRTAQMAYDLKFPGAPVFFSWPSTATYSGYGADEDNIEFSRRHLTDFIQDFAEKSGADNIYLIAHSMGNRALTGALGELFSSKPEIKSKIREIILAAPDIDAQIFKADIAPKFAGSGVPVTLYASSNDWALWVSKFWHQYARAGDTSTGMTLVSGITTIDSSAVDTSFLGHDYYAESTSVITDIFNILQGQFDPSKRPNLLEKMTPDGKYWAIQK